MKRVLFVFHEDTETGAPKVFLEYLKLLSKKSNYLCDAYILSYKNELFETIEMYTQNVYIPNKKVSKRQRLIKFLQTNKSKIIFNEANYDVIYGNTILTLKFLANFKKQNPLLKTILHVHESEYLCDLFLQKDKDISYFNYIDKIICVSRFCSANLITNYNIDEKKISIVYPSVEIKEEQIKDVDITDISNKFIITNICNPHYTKGTDLIPQIAKEIEELDPNLDFVIFIIGLRELDAYIKGIRLDIRKLNLENRIIFIPHLNNPSSYLLKSNIYIIPSREDSFTTVGVEAGLWKIPIVSFENNGGLIEVFPEINEVDYLNTKAFAKEIIRISKELQRSIFLQETPVQLNHSENCEKINNIINTI